MTMVQRSGLHAALDEERRSELQGLFRSLLASERLAEVRCDREASRHRGEKAGLALASASAHAARTSWLLPIVARDEGLRADPAISLGTLTTMFHDAVASRFGDPDDAYERALGALQAGDRTVRSIGAIACATARVELHWFCDRWRTERQRLLADAASAFHPSDPMARPPFAMRPTLSLVR